MCVTASGIGTAWWLKVYDALDGLIFSEAGGYEGNTPVCFGQSCNTNGYNLTHSAYSETLRTCAGFTAYDYYTYSATLTYSNGLDSSKFGWIPPYDASYFTGYNIFTSTFSEDAVYEDACDAYTCSKTKNRNWVVLCSGNVLWDLTGIAASGKDFTYTDIEGNTVTSNYAYWSEVCVSSSGAQSADCSAPCVPEHYFNIEPSWLSLP